MAGGIDKIDRLISGISSVRDDLVYTIGEVAKRQEGAIIEGVTENMYSGVDGYGNPIEPEYTRYTKWLKKQQGEPYDRVTLRDTGAFYKSLAISNTGDGVMIMSRNTMPWHKTLPIKYGFSILRPDTDSINENIIVPLRLEIVRQLKSIAL